MPGEDQRQIKGGRMFCPWSVRMVWATRALNDVPPKECPIRTVLVCLGKMVEFPL
jgi:hypothetical protein